MDHEIIWGIHNSPSIFPGNVLQKAGLLPFFSDNQLDSHPFFKSFIQPRLFGNITRMFFVFHAEESKDPQGFFFELLQRVVSQQIAPIYTDDFIISVKILPGSFSEGLHTLKRSMKIESLLFGYGRDRKVTENIKSDIEDELEINILSLD